MRFCYSTKTIIKILLLLALGLPMIGLGQTASVSPYSRFGLGDRDFNGFALNMHMAGMGAAVWDSLHMNPYNPATYGNLMLTSMEIGVRSKMVQLNTAELSSETVGSSQLSHFAIGLPIGKHLGGSFGIFPYSKLAYSVVSRNTLDSIGGVNYEYNGSGGVNAAYIGLAVKPFTGLSIGVNMTYLFGNLERSTGIVFDSTHYFNSKAVNLTRIGDAYFNFGLQYRHKFSNGWYAVVGGQFGATDQINSNFTYTTYNYSISSGSEFPKDTVEFIDGLEGTIRLPQSGSYGFSFGQQNSWMFSAEYRYQNFSEFSDVLGGDSLANTSRYMVGGYFIPDARALTGFWNRTQYRAGLYYGQTPLVLKGQQLVEYGMSFGLGLPFISRGWSSINIGAEIGQRGTTDNGLIKENYFMLNFGLTLNDKWFIKRRID